MALFEQEQITDTLDTGAPSIKYEGDEGPQDPRQEQMLAQLREEYMQYVFSQNELGEPVMSFEEWYQMVYEASKMGVQAPQEEMMMREPAAYGGIMDLDSGRRAYGLGSFFKKITKIPKKIFKGATKALKSPLGKAAALYFAPALIPGGASTMSGVVGNMLKGASMPDHLTRSMGGKESKKGILSAAKKFLTGNKKGIASLGIGALSALPLLGIGTQKEQQVVPDMGKLGSFDFDYDQMIRDVKGAKTTEDLAALNTKYGTDLVEDETVYDYAQGGRIGYAGGALVEGMAAGIEKIRPGSVDVIEKIKEGIIEGGGKVAGPFMDEAIWIEKIKDFIRKKRGDLRPGSMEEIEELYEGLRPMGRKLEEMPRRKYALGTKADFAMEDIMTGGMEDEIGGITGIMRQADLQRKGNVGQFYAAQGGRIGYAGGNYVGSKQNVTLSDEYNSYLKEGGTMSFPSFAEMMREDRAQGGRIGAQEGGIMDLGGMEKDYRETGGFVPLGEKEKADDVPARLSVNEFVMTADAVRGAGDGDIDLGAERMEDLMEKLEAKNKRQQGASDMFEVSERLSEVV